MFSRVKDVLSHEISPFPSSLEAALIGKNLLPKFFPIRVTSKIKSDIFGTIKVKNQNNFCIFQRVWKTIKRQEKIMEKSGNFEVNDNWQLCLVRPLNKCYNDEACYS